MKWVVESSPAAVTRRSGKTATLRLSGSAHVSTRSHNLNTIQLNNDEEEVEEGINSFEIIICLLVYVKVQIDKEIITATVDSGITCNFISLEEA
ncbi:unnamed protein product [Spirodela intermedia]|uniref:Uncharacterized protein n=1 Tax=Spirodela intermedia TaxID=51605 RepID=A0A7I8J778_SPIIN|nr:unnamed protein product [Spirodela intermedia]CAA6665919.1 unnamed protein product [Spirodela intermedia]